MKADELMAVPWRTGLRWHDGVRGSEYGWGVPLPGGSEVIASFRPRPGMTEEDCRSIQRFHEAAPAMAKALLAVYEHDKRSRDNPEDANRSPTEAVAAALNLAGVPLS